MAVSCSEKENQGQKYARGKMTFVAGKKWKSGLQGTITIHMIALKREIYSMR